MGLRPHAVGAVVASLVIVGATVGCGRQVVRASAGETARRAGAPQQEELARVESLIGSNQVFLPEYRSEAKIDEVHDERSQIARESFDTWRTRSSAQLRDGLPSDQEALEDLAESFGVDVETMSRLLEESEGQLKESGISVPAVAEVFDSVSSPIYSEPVEFCGVPSAVSLFPVVGGRPSLVKPTTGPDSASWESVAGARADGGGVWLSESPADGYRTWSWIPAEHDSISIVLTTSAKCGADDAVDSITVEEVPA